MIKIVRTAKPAVLNPAPDPSKKAYAKSEVRRSLVDMQHGKCCYCERRIDLTEVFPEDESLAAGSNVEKHVEHFRPKGNKAYRHLTNEWSNLLLACNTCNTNKGQKFEEDTNGNPLCIDPSDPDIVLEDHIEFREISLKIRPDGHEGKILPRDNSVKAIWTIATVKLNESTCRKGRWEKGFKVLKEILDYRQENPDTKEAKLRLRLLSEKCAAKEEYAFVAREICRQYKVPVEF